MTIESINTWSLTKKISSGLALLALLLCAVVVFSLLLGKESRPGELLVPVLLGLCSLVLRSRATKRMTELRTAPSV